jgi:hypothetical protein
MESIKDDTPLTPSAAAGFELMCIGKDLMWYFIATFFVGFNYGLSIRKHIVDFYVDGLEGDFLIELKLLSFTNIAISMISSIFLLLFFQRIITAGKILYNEKHSPRREYDNYKLFVIFIIIESFTYWSYYCTLNASVPN